MTSRTTSDSLPPFSVLLPVHAGADAAEFEAALESVIDQSVRPDEIVIVKDGPLTADHNQVIENIQETHADLIATVSISRNVGLGQALNTGLEYCSNALVARMDADDISVENRFEKQLHYFTDNPQIDVVGGYIGEIEEGSDSVTRTRSVPVEQDRIEDMATTRCPLNHPTVMFRKEAVEGAGGYADMRSMQDYELWARMLSKGYVLSNIPEILVTTSVGDDLYQRRGGFEYARTEISLQRRFLSLGHVTRPEAAFNLLTRVPVRFLPGTVREIVYQTLFREEETAHEGTETAPDQRSVSNEQTRSDESLNVLYIVSTLERSGPTNQLYYLVNNLPEAVSTNILTLSPEPDDSRWSDFEAIGVNCLSLENSHIRGWANSFIDVPVVARVLDPDVVHTMGIRADTIAAAKLSGYPRVATVRNYAYEDYPSTYGPIQGNVMAATHLLALRAIDNPIGCSETIASRIRQHGVAAQPIQNGVDAERYSPADPSECEQLRRELELPDGTIVISVGHLNERKDPFTVIEGYKSSDLHAGDGTLVFLGTGDLRKECEEHAADVSDIRFEGRVDNVEEYLKAADYFVSASRSEGLPNTVMEALSTGVPTCLSDIGPHEEILQYDDEAGTLFRVESPTDLATALDTLTEQDHSRTSAAARSIVEEQLSAKRMSREYHQLYEKI